MPREDEDDISDTPAVGVPARPSSSPMRSDVESGARSTDGELDAQTKKQSKAGGDELDQSAAQQGSSPISRSPQTSVAVSMREPARSPNTATRSVYLVCAAIMAGLLFVAISIYFRPVANQADPAERLSERIASLEAELGKDRVQQEETANQVRQLLVQVDDLKRAVVALERASGENGAGYARLEAAIQSLDIRTQELERKTRNW